MADAEADFDERAYLLQHPDVLRAVVSGALASGRAHYEQYGRAENRALGQPSPRDADVLEARRVAILAERLAGQAELMARGFGFEPKGWQNANSPVPPETEPNPLREFFDERTSGAGIWKWTHYFDIYHRFLQRFRGTDVHVLEIGIYSGGSLEMWRNYFGPRAKIYGVDIEPACKVYETEGTQIFIGDQADRKLWREFRESVPILDIVIEDGGHQPEQQIVTMEELLPHLRPGGVYICEDIHGSLNPVASYACGLSRRLNDFANAVARPDDQDRPLSSRATPFQEAVSAMHLYPFMMVVERNTRSPDEFVAPRHGSNWQPFYAKGW